MTLNKKEIAELILATEDEQEESEKVKDLQKTINRLHKQLDKAKNNKDELSEAIYSAVRDSIADIDIPKVKPPKLTVTKSKNEEVAVITLADWQMGKKTPTYNSEICQKRIEQYAKKVQEITAIHRKSHTIKKAHIWILGDIVEGVDIFPGQAWVIDSGLYRQIMKNGLETLTNFIREMLATFDEVKVVSVIGNHGRIGRYGTFHPEDNADRILYETTRLMFSGEKRLTWVNPEEFEGDRGWYAVDKIGKYSCLLIHGDQFRGQLGIPWYGVKKKVVAWKALGSQSDMPFPDFKDVAFGHWHQQLTWTDAGITMRCSPSPESNNYYAAENLAALGLPAQRMMFVNPKKGIVTADYENVWLD